MRLWLHAPKVHEGGGYVLLQAFLAAASGSLRWAQLDQRTRDRLELNRELEVCYVARTGLARALAEWRLWRRSQSHDVTLCFHGMPPLFPLRGRVVVFQQNRNLLGMNSLKQFPVRIALRIALERLIGKIFRSHVDEYVVQTETMARNLRRWHGGEPAVRVLPFADLVDVDRNVAEASRDYDFVYVATGDAHKNHDRLIDAWVLLSEMDISPSLVLTVGPENERLLARIERLSSTSTIRIDNLGRLPREQVLDLYKRSRALIFPSTSESFGLPLLEADACGLPIVASELDYVRDLVNPVETFDAGSAVSISRAVRRFLECPEAPLSVMTANEFLERILHP